MAEFRGAPCTLAPQSASLFSFSFSSLSIGARASRSEVLQSDTAAVQTLVAHTSNLLEGGPILRCIVDPVHPVLGGTREHMGKQAELSPGGATRGIPDT